MHVAEQFSNWLSWSGELAVGIKASSMVRLYVISYMEEKQQHLIDYTTKLRGFFYAPYHEKSNTGHQIQTGLSTPNLKGVYRLTFKRLILCS